MRYALIIITFLLGYSSYSQSLMLGAALGLNGYTLNSNLKEAYGNENLNLKLSYNLGLYFDGTLSDQIGLIVIPQYSKRGCRYNDDGEPTKFLLDYVGLPTMIKFKVSDELSFSLGVEGNFLIGADLKAYGSKFNYDAFFNNQIDLGILVGGAYVLAEEIALTARYSYGILSTTKNRLMTSSSGDPLGALALYNRGLSVSFVYFLNANDDYQ